MNSYFSKSSQRGIIEKDNSLFILQYNELEEELQSAKAQVNQEQTFNIDLEERLGPRIDNLTKELEINKQLLNDKQSAIIEKQTSILTLKTEYDRLEGVLQSA